jgi:hypothetical protein
MAGAAVGRLLQTITPQGTTGGNGRLEHFDQDIGNPVSDLIAEAYSGGLSDRREIISICLMAGDSDSCGGSCELMYSFWRAS